MTVPRHGREGTTAAPLLSLWLLALFPILVWGGVPLATKIAVRHLDPLLVATLRTLLAAAAVLPFLAWRRVAPPAGKTQRGFLAVSALGGPVGFAVLFTLGVGNTSASHAALIIAVAPVFTGLFAAAFDRTLPGRSWWLGCTLAMTGEVWLVASGAGGDGGATVLGDAAALGGMISAAVGYVAGARLSRTYPAFRATAWSGLVGAVLLLPVFAGMAGAAVWNAVPLEGWLAVAYLSLGASLLAYVAWYGALARGGIARVGLVQFLQPIVAVALAVLFLSEPLTPMLLVTACLIIAGVALAQRPDRSRITRREP